MTDDTATRTVLDRAREPWTVEEVSAAAGAALLRFRHDLGYELTALAERPLHRLTDRELMELLDDGLRRRPPSAVPEAA